MVVVMLSVIILIWSQSFFDEMILKEIAGGESKNIEKFCREIAADPLISVTGGSFGITNTGNIPIYSLNFKNTTGASSDVIKITPEMGGLINPGFSTLIRDESGGFYDSNDYDQIKLIPILLGKVKSGGIKEFECPEEWGILVK
jgi:hypothetical protein